MVSLAFLEQYMANLHFEHLFRSLHFLWQQQQLLGSYSLCRRANFCLAKVFRFSLATAIFLSISLVSSLSSKDKPPTAPDTSSTSSAGWSGSVFSFLLYPAFHQQLDLHFSISATKPKRFDLQPVLYPLRWWKLYVETLW